MLPSQKQVLKQKIRQLQGEVVERVKNYLSHHRTKKNIKCLLGPNNQISCCESVHLQNMSTEIQGNPNQIQILSISPQPKTKSTFLKTIPRKSMVCKSADRANKSTSLSREITSKKQGIFDHIQVVSGKQQSLQDVPTKKLQQILSKLKKENSLLRHKYSKLENTFVELRQKYEAISSGSEAQNDQLMDKIAKMQRNLKCLKCGEEELRSKLQIYKKKNQLIIAALNDSEEQNYQLKLKIQKLTVEHSQIIKQDPYLEQKSMEWQNSQKQIGTCLFEALCNLPTIEENADSSSLFPPENQSDLKNAVCLIKKFSECYDDLVEIKISEFRNVIQKMFDVMKKLLQKVQIDRKMLGKIFEECGFDGSDSEQVCIKVRGLIRPKKGSESESLKRSRKIEQEKYLEMKQEKAGNGTEKDPLEEIQVIQG